MVNELCVLYFVGFEFSCMWFINCWIGFFEGDFIGSRLLYEEREFVYFRGRLKI